MTDTPDKTAVKSYLLDLQERICRALEAVDGGRFRQDEWRRPQGVVVVPACWPMVRLLKKVV